MKTMLRRVFAVFMAVAIAITAVPMMEAKAEEIQEILVDCTWLDESGVPVNTSTSVEVPVNVTYGELKETLEAPLSTENFTFTGWDAYYEDTEIVTSGRAVLEATYDKYPVRFVKVYVDGNNNVITQRFTNYYPAGTTFTEIFPECTVTPEDMGTQYEFTKWNTSIYPAEEVGMNKTYCEIFADYKDHNIIRLTYDYVKDMGDYGVPVDGDKYLFVEKEIALSGNEDAVFQPYFEQNHAPTDHYAALGFTGWEWRNGDNWDAEEQNDNEWALYLPIYSKAQIILETEDESKVYAGEPGGTIQLPTEIDGQSVTWKCTEDGLVYEGSYTVPSDVDGSDEITLRAVIEKQESSNQKQEITFVKEEYIEDGYWSYDYETITVDPGASIEQMIAQLTPGKDVAGLTFEGWNYFGEVEGTIPAVRATYNKHVVTIGSLYYDENGEGQWKHQDVFVEKNATYKDLISYLDTPESVMGCSFVEWSFFNDLVSMDDPIDTKYADFQATYDKYPVEIQKLYIDNTGSAKLEKTIKIYDAGTSLKDICNENNGAPSDALNGSVEWFDCNCDDEVAMINSSVDYHAKYEDKVIVEYDCSYYADTEDYGEYITETIYEVLDNETCLSEEKLATYFTNNMLSKLDIKHYDKLEFEGWNFVFCDDITNDGYIDYVSLWAKYDIEDKIRIESYIDMIGEWFVWVVEAGQTVKLPSSYEGYYLTWNDGYRKLPKDDIYTIPTDAKKGDVYSIGAKKEGKILTQNDALASFEDKNSILPRATTITSIKIESGGVFEEAKKLIENEIKNILNIAAFEIDMYDKDGVKLQQLNGSVNISVELPFDVAEGNDLRVYRIDEEKLVECPVLSAKERFCTFETDHFSTYIFVEEKDVPETNDTTNDKTNDTTNDTTNSVPKTNDTINGIPYITLLLLGAGVLMVGSKKRNYN